MTLLRAYSWFYTQVSLLLGSNNYVEYWRTKLAQPHSRQAPYPQYSLQPLLISNNLAKLHNCIFISHYANTGEVLQFRLEFLKS